LRRNKTGRKISSRNKQLNSNIGTILRNEKLQFENNCYKSLDRYIKILIIAELSEGKSEYQKSD